MRPTIPLLLATLALLGPTTQLVSAQEAARLTAWGAPDLQGVWDFRTITPLERPAELAGKEVLTVEEAAAFQQRTLDAQDKDQRADVVGVSQDVESAYNQFWWDYGDSLTEDRRTSLVVDPRDGRVPRKPRDRTGLGAAAASFGRIPAGPEDRSLWERCILGFNSGPPLLPSAYNNNVQILQTPDTVVIFNEMVHNARVVPLDGRAHLPDDVRLWTGDARGRWEGSTLVVETKNFVRETGFLGAGAAMRLVERFEQVDANTLRYEFTIDDPEHFTQPWTAAIPMKRTDGPMFEYACHEGNYGMTNLLLGARADDAAAR
jgi:hypothetical protein